MMEKDIFIDNNAAKNFCNPLDPEYKKLIKWLSSEGWLVTSQKIIAEYVASTGDSCSVSNIVCIINKLTIENRRKHFNNEKLKNTKIPERISRKFKSNIEDHEHIKLVMMSTRRYALVLDKNLRDDINGYPRIKAIARKRPQDIPYAE